MALFRCDISSQALEMATTVNVIIPDLLQNKEDLKVVYLLHGLSDNCSNWQRLTSVERYARDKMVAVVIPEVQRSFYVDMEYGLKYFTYISDELPILMNYYFGFKNQREYKYVAGLSMGGYGALKIALRCNDNFCACAAFSAACDVKYEVKIKRISSPIEYKAIFGVDEIVKDEDDLFYLATKCNDKDKSLKPKILMTCGTEDFLYTQNIAFRDHMRMLDFDYEYREWQGDHSWDFWDTSLKMAFDYFFNI